MHVEEERLGDLPPALGQQLALPRLLCSLPFAMATAPRMQLCWMTCRNPSWLFAGTVTRCQGGLSWQAVICTLVSSHGLLDSPLSAHQAGVTVMVSCVYISPRPLTSVHRHSVSLPLTSQQAGRSQDCCCIISRGAETQESILESVMGNGRASRDHPEPRQLPSLRRPGLIVPPGLE